jgi:hypothetical protein
MCIDINLFDETKISSDMICPIGHGVIVKKVGLICKNNEKSFLHIFCETCFLEYHVLGKGKSCPLCKYPIKNNVVYLDSSDQTDNLELKCENNNCDWNGKLINYNSHIVNCDYHLEKCNKCKQQMFKKDLSKHLNECPERQIFCKICESVYLAKNSDFHVKKITCELCLFEEITQCSRVKHEQQKCEEYCVKCLSCKMMIKRKNMENHKTSKCLEREIFCKFCDKIYLAKNSNMHEEYHCQYCDEIITKCNEENHYNLCKEYVIKCNLCSEDIKKIQKKEHIKVCSNRIVKCETCKEKYKLKDEYLLHNKKIVCDKCFMDIYACEKNSHGEVCLGEIIECDFIGCGEKYARKDREQHNIENRDVHLIKMNKIIKEQNIMLQSILNNNKTSFIESKTESKTKTKTPKKKYSNSSSSSSSSSLSLSSSSSSISSSSSSSELTDSSDIFEVFSIQKKKMKKMNKKRYDNSCNKICDNRIYNDRIGIGNSCGLFFGLDKLFY